MLAKPLTVYLAGAIRDDHQEDIDWREDMIQVLSPYACILNPVGGKVYNQKTHAWTMAGVPADARTIVHQDFWCVDRSDLIVFNFKALAEGYPNIGTLVEFGHATASRKLIYAIIPEDYKGHENTTMYRLHPFLEQNCSLIFRGEKDCARFLLQHLRMLTGADPNFGGYQV